MIKLRRVLLLAGAWKMTTILLYMNSGGYCNLSLLGMRDAWGAWSCVNLTVYITDEIEVLGME
jgi:hypothetical protein